MVKHLFLGNNNLTDVGSEIELHSEIVFNSNKVG